MLFEFLGVPSLISWLLTIIIIAIFIIPIINEFKFRYSKECRNCKKITETKHAILCNDCLKEYAYIFPKNWKNKK